MFKVDIFPPAGLFDIRCLERAVIKPILEADPESRLPLASAEDIILHKLLWFRMGGGASERQWLDVINVLKVQAGRLDEDYLDRWANDLDLVPLLCEARKDAQR